MRSRDIFKAINTIAEYYGYIGAYVNEEDEGHYDITFIRAGAGVKINYNIGRLSYGLHPASRLMCLNVTNDKLVLPTFLEDLKNEDDYTAEDEFTAIEIQNPIIQTFRLINQPNINKRNHHAFARSQGGYTGIVIINLNLSVRLVLLSQDQARHVRLSKDQITELVNDVRLQRFTYKYIPLIQAISDNHPSLPDYLLTTNSPEVLQQLREQVNVEGDNLLTIAMQKDNSHLIDLSIRIGIDHSQAITWCMRNVEERESRLIDYLKRESVNIADWRSQGEGANIVHLALRHWSEGRARFPLLNVINRYPERLLPGNYNQLTDFTDYVLDETVTYNYISDPILPAKDWQHPTTGKTLLDIAIERGWHRVARLIVHGPNDANKPNLNLAVERLGIRHLLRINYNEEDFMHYLDKYFSTTAANYTENGSHLAHIMLEKGWRHAFTYLLDRGFDPKAYNAHGETALYLMVANPTLHSLIDNFLRRPNLDLEKRTNHNGFSALHLCAQLGLKSIAIKLINAGGNPGLPTRDNRTIIHLSSQHADDLRMFFTYLYDDHQGGRAKNTFDLIHHCIKAEDDVTRLQQIVTSPSGVNLLLTNDDNECALTAAAKRGHAEQVGYLLTVLLNSREKLIVCGNRAIAAIHTSHDEIRQEIIIFMMRHGCVQSLTLASLAEHNYLRSIRTDEDVNRMRQDLNQILERVERNSEQLQQILSMTEHVDANQERMQRSLDAQRALINQIRQFLLNNNPDRRP